MAITDGLLHTAHRAPRRIAIARGDERVTYATLAARVDAIAAGVRRRTTGTQGAVVTVDLAEPFDWLAAFLGVAHAGAVAAPLSPTWPAARRAQAIERCAPVLTLHDAADLARIETGEGGRGEGDYVADTAPFYIGFTSGSTGEPRGVVRDHRAWERSFVAMSQAFNLDGPAGGGDERGGGARVLVPGSLCFSFSLIAALHALAIGGTMVVPSHPGPRALVEAFAAVDAAGERIDAAHVLPSLLRDTLALAERRGRAFDGVRRVICAGEPLTAETRALVTRVCPSAGLYEYYGASELGFVTLLAPDEAEAHPGSVGRTFPGSEVAVLDEPGVPAAPGEIGVLCARTPYGGTTYLGGESLDRALDHHGWRTVGDLGRIDADSYVYLAGRRDRMVILRGENVYPEAVEAALLACPGVAAASVVARPTTRPTHLVAAIEAPGNVDPTAILEAVRATLPPHAAPRRIVRVEALPRTATGKVDHAAVARLIADR